MLQQRDVIFGRALGAYPALSDRWQPGEAPSTRGSEQTTSGPVTLMCDVRHRIAGE